MNTKMNNYTTPKLFELHLEMESILCSSGELGKELGSSFDKWNEEEMDWK